jgi:hypothetical protein
MVVVGCNGRGVARTLLGQSVQGMVRSAEVSGRGHSRRRFVTPHSDRSRAGGSRLLAAELALAIAFDEASRRAVELTALHA